jgi:excisionase family DNA binding protein
LTEGKRQCHHVVPTIRIGRFDRRMLVPETLTPDQAGEYLQIPTETLRRWRGLGTGPKFAKVGRHVRYREAELIRWLEQREREAGGGRTA